MTTTGAGRPFSHALVTGGAGFIGARLTGALLDAGLEVTVLDDLSAGRKAAVDPRARFVHGDVRRGEDVHGALDGVDCVFHLAARVSIRASYEKFYDDVDTNLMGTLNLLRHLEASAVRHLTLASSMAVYSDSPHPVPVAETHSRDPIAPYGVSKLAAERICHQILGQLRIRFTALRYFNTFGSGQTYTSYVGVITIFITNLLNGKDLVIFGDGEQQRDFVHIDDIVAGTLASLDAMPGTFNLGTGRATSVNQLAALLTERLGVARPPVHRAAQAGELRYCVADITAAVELLGYRPARSLETHVDDVIESIRAKLNGRAAGQSSTT